jgi:hypothetical protein
MKNTYLIRCCLLLFFLVFYLFPSAQTVRWFECKYFNQGTDIPNVINQVILSSDYGRQALDPDKIDSDGFINWWRIDTQVYMLDTDATLARLVENQT